MKIIEKQSNFTYIIVLTIILSVIVKTIFIFHGKWDAQTFVPYNTDETIVLNFMQDYFNLHAYNIYNLVNVGYFTFLHNFFFIVLNNVVYFARLINQNIDKVQIYSLMAYSGRFIIVLFSVLLSIYAWLTFKRLFKNKWCGITYLILLNFNVIYFSWSHYIKYDFIVVALGFMSIYYGLKYYNNQTNRNYFKFYIFTILSVSANIYGYVYLLNLIIISLVVQKFSFFRKKFNIILILITPVIFSILNWQNVIYFKLVIFNMRRHFDNSIDIILPFATDANGLNSGLWYLLYLKDIFSIIVFPLIITGIYFLFRVKNTNYYKLLLVSFLIFFMHLSFSSYRSDRMLIPFFAIILFFAIFVFDHFINIFKNKNLKIVSGIILLLFIAIPILFKTSIYAKSLLQKDTRYILYEWLQENLYEGENITFIHHSISGAFSTMQKITNDNTKNFHLKMIDLNNINESEEKFNSLKGYVIISNVDYQIIKDYSNLNDYKVQYKRLGQLINDNKIVASIDNNNFLNRRTFGTSSYSFYGFRNPSLSIIKITKNIITEKKPYIQIDPSLNIINERDFKGQNVIGWDTYTEKQSDKALLPLSNNEFKIKTVELRDNIIKNSIIITSDINKIFLATNYKNDNEVFGFGNKSYEDKAFLVSAWVKTSKDHCVRIKFYTGNVLLFTFSDYNNFSSKDDNYELISLKNKFDKPYTLNGQLFFEIQPQCTVEILNPAVYIGDMTIEDMKNSHIVE